MNIKMLHTKKNKNNNKWILSVCPPPVCYAPPTPVTKYVSLHSKSLCKDMARASWACKKYAHKAAAQTYNLKTIHAEI